MDKNYNFFALRLQKVCLEHERRVVSECFDSLCLDGHMSSLSMSVDGFPELDEFDTCLDCGSGQQERSSRELGVQVLMDLISSRRRHAWRMWSTFTRRQRFEDLQCTVMQAMQFSAPSLPAEVKFEEKQTMSKPSFQEEVTQRPAAYRPSSVQSQTEDVLASSALSQATSLRSPSSRGSAQVDAVSDVMDDLRAALETEDAHETGAASYDHVKSVHVAQSDVRPHVQEPPSKPSVVDFSRSASGTLIRGGVSLDYGFVGQGYDGNAIRLRSRGRIVHRSERHHGQDHPEVAQALVRLADHQLGAPSMMQTASLQRALRIQERHFGKDHIRLLDTLSRLFSLHRETGHVEAERVVHSRIESIKARQERLHCVAVHQPALAQDAKPPDSSRYAVLKSELAQERARADKLQLLNDEAVVSELCQSSGCARTNHRWSGDVDIVRELSTDQANVDEVIRLAEMLLGSGLLGTPPKEPQLLPASLLCRLVERLRRAVMCDALRWWSQRSAIMSSVVKMAEVAPTASQAETASWPDTVRADTMTLSSAMRQDANGSTCTQRVSTPAKEPLSTHEDLVTPNLQSELQVMEEAMERAAARTRDMVDAEARAAEREARTSQECAQLRAELNRWRTYAASEQSFDMESVTQPDYSGRARLRGGVFTSTAHTSDAKRGSRLLIVPSPTASSSQRKTVPEFDESSVHLDAAFGNSELDDGDDETSDEDLTGFLG